MEYCLSLLYVAMDELGLIWCMDAFMERRHKDWRFWGSFLISALGSFCLFNFVIGGITVLHTIAAYAVLFAWGFLLFRITSVAFLMLLVLLYSVISYFISFAVMGTTAHLLRISVQTLRDTYFPFIASSILNYLLLLMVCFLVKKSPPVKKDKRHTLADFTAYSLVSSCQFCRSSYPDFYKSAATFYEQGVILLWYISCDCKHCGVSVAGLDREQ